MELANPDDLQLECGGYGSSMAVPVGADPVGSLVSDARPAILDIAEIIVHPDYAPELGPASGSDIATIKLKVSG